LNEWGLLGDWTIKAEHAVLDQKDGGIVFKFRARDLHLVLGSPPDGKKIRFLVKIDGKAPGASHGSDVDPGGHPAYHRFGRILREGGAPPPPLSTKKENNRGGRCAPSVIGFA
jgi:hypothetical protein